MCHHEIMHQILKLDSIIRAKGGPGEYLCVIVITSTLCWLPIHVFSLWYRLDESNFEVGDVMYTFPYENENCYCNPLIYAFMGVNFRKYLKQTFPNRTTLLKSSSRSFSHTFQTDYSICKRNISQNTTVFGIKMALNGLL